MMCVAPLLGMRLSWSFICGPCSDDPSMMIMMMTVYSSLWFFYSHYTNPQTESAQRFLHLSWGKGSFGRFYSYTTTTLNLLICGHPCTLRRWCRAADTLHGPRYASHVVIHEKLYNTYKHSHYTHSHIVLARSHTLCAANFHTPNLVSVFSTYHFSPAHVCVSGYMFLYICVRTQRTHTSSVSLRGSWFYEYAWYVCAYVLACVWGGDAGILCCEARRRPEVSGWAAPSYFSNILKFVRSTSRDDEKREEEEI